MYDFEDLVLTVCREDTTSIVLFIVSRVGDNDFFVFEVCEGDGLIADDEFVVDDFECSA